MERAKAVLTAVLTAIFKEYRGIRRNVEERKKLFY
jgi:hypothetical protein